MSRNRKRSDDAEEQLELMLHLAGITGYKVVPERCKLEANPVVIALRPVGYSQTCEQCGREMTHCGSYWRENVRHPRIVGQRIVLSVQVPRLECEQCANSVSVELPGIHQRKRHTDALRRCAEEALSLRHTFADVAQQMGCSTATAARMAAARVKALDASRILRAPHFLSFDEISVSCGTICPVVDPLARVPLEVLRDYDQKTVEDFIANLPNPKDVWVVTLDMASHLADVIMRMLPNARIVIDPWHIKRTLIKCFRRLIKAALKQLDPKTTEALRKGENRRLLTTRRGGLVEKQRTTELLKIDSWCAQSPLLRDGYRYLQRMYTLWDRPIDSQCAQHLFRRFTYFDLPATARKFFEQAIFQNGKRRPSFLEQVENHWDQVFAYWETGLTSGYVESLNHTIRDLNRAARGMKFETLRGRILYGHSATSELSTKRFRKPRKSRVIKAPLPLLQSPAVARRGRRRKRGSTGQMMLPLPVPSA